MDQWVEKQMPKEKVVCIVECPSCKCLVEILQINCAIFRHGIYKHNGQQLNPHLPKAECDRLAAIGAIHGCGKPFKLKPTESAESPFEAEVCDYV